MCQTASSCHFQSSHSHHLSRHPCCRRRLKATTCRSTARGSCWPWASTGRSSAITCSSRAFAAALNERPTHGHTRSQAIRLAQLSRRRRVTLCVGGCLRGMGKLTPELCRAPAGRDIPRQLIRFLSLKPGPFEQPGTDSPEGAVGADNDQNQPTSHDGSTSWRRFSRRAWAAGARRRRTYSSVTCLVG